MGEETSEGTTTGDADADGTPMGDGDAGDAPMGDDGGSATVPWRAPTVQVVLASTVLAPLGVPLVAPALPVVRDAFGVGDAAASLLVSTYFLTGIVLSPFIGLLADRVGRRRVLLPSLLTFGLAGGAMALAPSFAALVALRVVQGTAAAGIFVTSVTLVGDVFDGPRRNAVLGVNNAALSAGAAVFPIVGGALAAVAWNAPFALYPLALPVALFAAWRLEEPAVEPTAAGLGYLRSALGAVAGVDAVVLYGAAFVTEVLLFGAVITGLPFHLTATYALAPVVVGAVLTAAEATSTVVSTQNGRLARHLSNRGLVAAGFGCYGVGLLGTWLAPSPATIAVAVGVFGAGLGLSMPAVNAAISDLVAAEHRGGALSLRNSLTFLGRAAGPVLFAGVAAATGYGTVLLIGAAVALATGGVALLAPRRRARVAGTREDPA